MELNRTWRPQVSVVGTLSVKDCDSDTLPCSKIGC